MAKLTTRFIEGVAGEDGRPTQISDDYTRGLYLRVSAAGVKSWFFRYTRPDGSRAKLGLGRFPSVGLADARERAAKAAVGVVEGRDPARERQIARRTARKPRAEKPQTLVDLWNVYDRDVMPAKRSSTQKYQRWVWRRLVEPRIGFLRLGEIDRGTVRAALREIGATGPTTANRALGLIRHMLNVAVDDELMLASPIARMGNLYKEGSRDRILNDDELRILWRAVDDEPGSDLQVSARLCVAIRLALVTGVRGIEIIGLHADEIDVPGRVWTIPASRFKGKRVHTVPLSPTALWLLGMAFGGPPETWEGHAFPNSRHECRHMERMSLTRAMQEIVRAAGIRRATPHDLRRTMATYMASERIAMPPHIISAVLGHASEGSAVTRVYNRHAYDKEKRAALEAWATLLIEVITAPISNHRRKSPTALNVS